jgi:tRNA dimethylallyltransferase
MSNNKIPVIVGGTNYYIESILWNVLIDSKQTNKRDEKQSLVFMPTNCILNPKVINIIKSRKQFEKKKYYQLFSLLNSHTNNLLRRNSF